MCISSTTGIESHARALPAAFVLAILILTSAAPAGAALPEDGARACQALGETGLIYVGQAGAAFSYQLHGTELEQARQAFLTVEAEHERSPEDAEIASRYVSALKQWVHWRSRSDAMTLVPMKAERVFRGIRRAKASSS